MDSPKNGHPEGRRQGAGRNRQRGVGVGNNCEIFDVEGSYDVVEQPGDFDLVVESEVGVAAEIVIVGIVVGVNILLVRHFFARGNLGVLEW